MAPTFRHGHNAIVYADGKKLSEILRAASHSRTVDTAETTVMGNDDKTYLPGVRDVTLNFEGLFDGSTGRVHEVLSGIAGTSPSTAAGIFTYGPGSSTRGATAKLVNGTLTSFDISSPVSDVVAVTATVQGSGSRTEANEGKFLTAGTTQRASTTAGSSYVTYGSTNTSSTAGGVAHLHMIAMNTGSVTITVEHSSGLGSATKATFTITKSASSTALRGYRIPITGTIKEFLRYAITSKTSTGTVDFALAVARY